MLTRTHIFEQFVDFSVSESSRCLKYYSYAQLYFCEFMKSVENNTCWVRIKRRLWTKCWEELAFWNSSLIFQTNPASQLSHCLKYYSHLHLMLKACL